MAADEAPPDLDTTLPAEGVNTQILGTVRPKAPLVPVTAPPVVTPSPIGRARRRRGPPPRVSVVIPALNEAESLPELAAGITKALEGQSFEIIFIDDGSTDDSWKVMSRLAKEQPEVVAMRLRKNFGKAMGLSAGFARAR